MALYLGHKKNLEEGFVFEPVTVCKYDQFQTPS